MAKKNALAYPQFSRRKRKRFHYKESLHLHLETLFLSMQSFDSVAIGNPERHESHNQRNVTTEPSDERNLSPGFIQLRTPARINICSATQQPPGTKLEMI